jgi:hypothetical protein
VDSVFEDAVLVEAGKSAAAASMVAAALLLLLLLLVCSFGRRDCWGPSGLGGAVLEARVVVGTGFDSDSGSGTTFGVVEMILAWLVWLDDATVRSNNLRRRIHF